MALTKIGGMVVATTAELSDADGWANYTGPVPTATDFFVKVDGCKVLLDIAGAGTDYALAIADGGEATSDWVILDGTTTPITPA